MLQVEVLLEFSGMGDLSQLGALGPLGLQEVADQLLGEDAALGEIGVIRLQGVQGLLQTGGQLVELGLTSGGRGAASFPESIIHRPAALVTAFHEKKKNTEKKTILTGQNGK